VLTKDRVGAGLAIAAAVLGLVLVFSFPQDEGGGDDDDAAPATPPVSQVVPAPGGQVPPAPGQVEQPAAPPQGDADGDDDG
jgi:hypothetical protein